ncbi:MAG: protein kinase family protein [Actinomycetota bacterium]|nr:protein kinase family protein [Actinomycetota bacterium]
MGDRRLLASGDVLADRYELQDLVTEKLGSSTWRAHDNILNRNVGIEMLPSSDPRGDHFLKAARESTTVTDPRFLRVLDLIESEKGHNLIIREWARAFPLDQLLLQSPLPNRRAATVVAEVAEALAHAHEMGVYHRRLSPHQVLLKQSGAVRVVGLGVASALSPVGTPESVQDLQAYEQLDVQALGKLLYACLVSRWPGAHTDGLRAAPTEHGRLLRPRQVRAGVSRDVDTVCDRILGTPPRHHEAPLRTAQLIANTLRLAGEDETIHDDQPSLARMSSPDLLRLDPVIVPAGPPPGINPPRRRPKAYEPAPPTTFERGKERAIRATKGDRKLILLGIAGALLLVTVLAFLVGRSTTNVVPDSPIDKAAPLRLLPIAKAGDFDPQGEDKAENPEEAALAIDGKPETGWRTSSYFGNERLGGLKDGVGVIIDLGGPREVDSVRVRLAGGATSFELYASAAGVDGTPRTLNSLKRIAVVGNASADSTVALPAGTLTRHIVVWLTKVPEVSEGTFRGEIREISIRGKS